MVMYKIKNKIRQLRKLFRWIPIIWNDRDWDYYFVYEILKQKLIDTEKYIRKDGVHIFNDTDADSILKAIELIEKVQTEYHLDKYLSEATEWIKMKYYETIYICYINSSTIIWNNSIPRI